MKSVHKKHIGVTTILLALIGVALLFVAVNPHFLKKYPELKEVSGTNWMFAQYADYFEALAEEKGGVYAYEILKRAELSLGTDLHLLGHVVGDVLYRQKGIDGIYDCTPDFRNACSHSIVVGLFDEQGVGALDEVADVCRDAPGGKGAYTMCFHGLGHGVLAYSLYDFEKAVQLCKKTATFEYHYQEYTECVGGEVMELLSGGGHDPEAWEKEREHYLSDDNPLLPCDADFMPDFVKPICYLYLTPHLFEVAGADIGHPTPDNFEKAFTYCDLLPENDEVNRDTCYGGFGKEFIALAGDRDIRDVGSMPTERLALIHQWCSLADNARGEGSCVLSALRSLFWGGENNPDASFTFCSIADPRLKDVCYMDLSSQIIFFFGGSPHKTQSLCNRLPDQYQSACLVNVQ